MVVIPVASLNLILLAMLIVMFPPLVAYLIAGFLLFDGAVFLLMAYRLWRFKKRSSQCRASWVQPAALLAAAELESDRNIAKKAVFDFNSAALLLERRIRT